MPSFKETFFGPSQTGTFRIGDKRDRRRQRRYYVEGWGFRLGGEPAVESIFPFRVVKWRSLVVLSEGYLYHDTQPGPEDWRPDSFNHTPGWSARDVGPEDLRAVLEQVLEWTDTRPSSLAPPVIEGRFRDDSDSSYREIRIALQRRS